MGKRGKHVISQTTRASPIKQKRKPQPGRRPPPYNPGAHANTRGSRRGETAERPLDEDPVEANRQERHYAGWAAHAPANLRAYIESFPAQLGIAKEKKEAALGVFHRVLGAALHRRRAEHSCSGGSILCLEAVDGKNVEYVSFSFKQLVAVPVHKCLVCKELIHVHPYDVGCQASGYGDAGNYWIDLEVLRLFEPLRLRHGVGVHGERDQLITTPPT